MRALQIIRAGTVPYEQAWAQQRELHAQRVAGEVPDTLLLLEHPPVYTAGKRTEPHERPLDGTPVVDVDRGGKITWHGPGQLVGYPIVELPDPVDVVAYVRRLEEALIEVCAGFGLATGRIEGRSGVWVAADAPGQGFRPERKIAAIGVRVARGVTMHGFALNCDPDLACLQRNRPVRDPRRRRDVAVGRAGPRHQHRRRDRAGGGRDGSCPGVRVSARRLSGG